MCLYSCYDAICADSYHAPCTAHPDWYRCTSWQKPAGCEDCTQSECSCWFCSPPPSPPSWPGVNSPILSVDWATRTTPEVPWSRPFELSAQRGKIWIAPSDELPLPDDANDADFHSVWRELKLKGTNWAGFQSPTACVHQLWEHDLSEYIDYLVDHQFNAVRLPLNAWVVTWHLRDDNPWSSTSHTGGNGKPFNCTYRCGKFNNLDSMSILDIVIGALRDVGIFGEYCTRAFESRQCICICMHTRPDAMPRLHARSHARHAHDLHSPRRQ